MNEKTSASAGDVVQKLERMVELVSDPQGGMDANAQAEFALLYGELEDVITGFVGTGRVEVPGHYGNLKNIFPNFIAAGFLSGRNFHRHEGRMQLLQVIGKAKSRIRAPLTAEASISALVRSLGRFRECCQYISEPPKNERDVQEILWIMMRAQFDRLDREDVLSRFGVRNYKPDFGIPDLGVLVEAKFIGEKTSTGDIQEELLADLPAYLAKATGYTGVLMVVYDAAHKLRDPRRFIEDLRQIEGVVDVIVVPGIG